jgi:hypothetical protein
VLRTSRVGSAALVAPTPRTPHIQHRYFADLRCIQTGSVQHPSLIHIRYTLHQQEIPMSKLKLEHGVSRIRRAKLQSSIDQTVADDIELLAEWSNNETNYVINELLRFALANEEEFQKYKASAATNASRPVVGAKASPAKSEPLPTSTASHA